MTRRLAGKCVVVTGAGSVGPGWGNGRATAVMFSGEASDEARFVTGTEIIVDGGMTVRCD